MADPPNGTNGTIAGAAARLGQSLIVALPPGFLLLLIINTIFMGLILKFLDDQMDQRTQLVGRLLDHCMQIESPK